MFVKKMSSAALVVVFGLALPVMVSISDAWAESMEGSESFGSLTLSMNAGAEYLSGDLIYSIGYPVTYFDGWYEEGYFPFSELTFPLDVAYATVGAEVLIRDQYKIGLTVKEAVSEPDDYMEDRDWLTWSNPGQLDVYSDSDVTDFSSTIWDVDATYRFYQGNKFSFAAGFGYQRQEFRYDTALITQWSPSGYDGYYYEGDGSNSILYNVDIEMIYFALDGTFHILPNLMLNGRFAYSPWVDIDDRDDHLLRYDYINLDYRVAEGHMQGNMFEVGVDVLFDITSFLYLQAGVDYKDIEAEGDSKITYSDYWYATITEEFDTKQASAFARIGFRFGIL